MKHILQTLLLLFTLAVVGQSQQPVKPLLTKITATWCPHCGAWGWTAMKDMIDRFHGDKASVLALHYSGDLADDLNISLADNFPVFGQPKFQYNGDDLGFGSTSYVGIMDEMDTRIANETMMINAFDISQSRVEIDQNVGSVSYAVDVMVDADNLQNENYTIGLYLVRDDVMAAQSGQSGEVAHFKILQSSLTEQTFGLDYEGAGTYTISSTIVTDDETLYDFESHEVIAILWNKVGESYDVITTEHASLSDGAISNTADIGAPEAANVYTDALGHIVVECSSVNHDRNGRAVLYSVTGRELDRQDLIQGRAVFTREKLLGKGLYIVSIESNQSLYTHKIIVE